MFFGRVKIQAKYFNKNHMDTKFQHIMKTKFELKYWTCIAKLRGHNTLITSGLQYTYHAMLCLLCIAKCSSYAAFTAAPSSIHITKTGHKLDCGFYPCGSVRAINMSLNPVTFTKYERKASSRFRFSYVRS